MPHELCLQRLALLPEAVTSISALETGDVVLCSKSSVWVFPSHFHGQALAQVECEATCILALGSQTIAAGDHAGRVRVWHLRRQILKEVRNVQVHFSNVRDISSGGDILLTASDDGWVKQLDVLTNFAPSGFFETGVPATSVLARGKNVLVGCEDGIVWELSRRLSQATILRRMELGVPILTLDADAEAPGARVLAAGRGRFAVWVGEGDSEEVQLAFHGKCGPAAAVRLLPGTTEDLLVIPDASLDAENDLLHSHPSFGLLCSVQCRSLTSDHRSELSFFLVGELLQGVTRQFELFKISPLEVSLQSKMGLPSLPLTGHIAAAEVNQEDIDNTDAEKREKTLSKSRSNRHINAFRDPTQASIAKSLI
ncbi:unnamed protein product [Durusdinium trenchii]|uniref:Uncharacterized protein n=1 Tax=Durusdinium trenchii TaxID=1381693 RepID=A0ABP0QD82_9DINO